MANAWLTHVKATMKLHKGKPFKESIEGCKENIQEILILMC